MTDTTTAVAAPLTLEEVLSGPELHYTGDGPCSVTVGPRGGQTVKVTRVRTNGAVQTWKTRPGQFSAPYKYGMRARDQFRVTNSDAAMYHPASRCPAGLH